MSEPFPSLSRDLYYERARKIARKTYVPLKDFFELFAAAIIEFGHMLAAIPPPTSAGRSARSRTLSPKAMSQSSVPIIPQGPPSPDDLIAEDLLEEFGDDDAAAP